MTSLHPFDLLVIAGYFLILLGIAYWAAKKEKNVSADFFLASRDVGWLAGAGADTAWIEGALRKVNDAVERSGLRHAELWSYRIENGKLVPSRYGTSSDVQLWSLTDLAVQFLLNQPRP